LAERDRKTEVKLRWSPEKREPEKNVETRKMRRKRKEERRVRMRAILGTLLLPRETKFSKEKDGNELLGCLPSYEKSFQRLKARCECIKDMKNWGNMVRKKARAV